MIRSAPVFALALTLAQLGCTDTDLTWPTENADVWFEGRIYAREEVGPNGVVTLVPPAAEAEFQISLYPGSTVGFGTSSGFAFGMGVYVPDGVFPPYTLSIRVPGLPRCNLRREWGARATNLVIVLQGAETGKCELRS